MNAKSEELRRRTKAFAVRIIKLFQALPHDTAAQVVGKQLLRCGTSVGANYRAACRARPKAEFVAKVGIVLEECDETVYWLELMVETKIVSANRLGALLDEAQQLTAIFTASQKTARGGK